MKTLSIISSIEFTTQSCFHQEVQGLASIEAFLGGDFYSMPDVFSVGFYGHDSRRVFFGCKKKMGQFLHENMKQSMVLSWNPEGKFLREFGTVPKLLFTGTLT